MDRSFKIVSLVVAGLAVAYAWWVNHRAESGQTVYGLILAVAGGIMTAGAGCDGDWFLEGRKVGWIVQLCSRTGARIVFVFAGVMLILFGLWTQRQ